MLNLHVPTTELEAYSTIPGNLKRREFQLEREVGEIAMKKCDKQYTA
jgi:hypothetical protein